MLMIIFTKGQGLIFKVTGDFTEIMVNMSHKLLDPQLSSKIQTNMVSLIIPVSVSMSGDQNHNYVCLLLISYSRKTIYVYYTRLCTYHSGCFEINDECSSICEQVKRNSK